MISRLVLRQITCCFLQLMLGFFFSLAFQLKSTAQEPKPSSILLENDRFHLNDTLCIGYGLERKGDLIGSVESVKAETIGKMAAFHLEDVLMENVTGLTVLQNSGNPGADPIIYLRGIALTNYEAPIIVIDGLYGGSLADLNPMDVESIEILKDAAYQGIYSNNGVIIVTTKHGKSGKLRVSLDIFAGFQQPWALNKVGANAQQYAAIFNQFQKTQGNADYFPYDEGSKTYYKKDHSGPLKTTDWTDEIFRTALVQNYNISLTGGGKVSNYFFSAGYCGQESTLLKTFSNRITVRLNSVHNITKWLKVGENLSFTNNVSSTQISFNEKYSPLNSAFQMLPFIPIYANDGYGNYAFKESGLASNVKNPLALIEYNNNQSTRNSFVGNVYIHADIIKGLSFDTRYGLNEKPSKFISFVPAHRIGENSDISVSQSVMINEYTREKIENYNHLWQNLLNYNFTVNQNHFSILLGSEYEKGLIYLTHASKSNVSIETDKWKEYADTADFGDLYERKINTAGFNYFGQLTYDYANFLFLQGNFRRSYSSITKEWYGNFQSLSAGLKFSEFQFVKNLNLIDFGKIRVGIGDTLATRNLGLDLITLNNKLAISIDLFEKSRNDLGIVKISQIEGGEIMTDSVIHYNSTISFGTVDNRGYEISVRYKDEAGNFPFEINANITHVITELDDIFDGLMAGTGWGVSNVSRTISGESASTFYGYKVEGIYQESDFVWYKNRAGNWKSVAADPTGSIILANTYDVDGNPIEIKTKNQTAQPGNFKYSDINKDGKIDAKDITKIGDPNPDFIYSFGANFEYKGFDLNLFFQGCYGNQIFNLLKISSYNGNNGGLNWSQELINAYIPATYNTTVRNTTPSELTPASNTTTGISRMDGDFSASDFYVEDGSYLRLKNIQIGYNLSKSIISKIKIEKFRIFIGARNLLTFTNYSGLDPEVGESSFLEKGFDRGTYPQSKMFLFGINASF